MSADQLDLDVLEAAVAKMTAEPWDADWLDSEQSAYCITAPALVEGGRGCIARTTRYKRGWEDAEGIVLLRNSADQLIALARRGQDAEAKYEAEFQAHGNLMVAAAFAGNERDAALARCAELEAALNLARYVITQERGYANTDHPPFKHVRDQWDETVNRALDSGDETT